MVETFFDLDDLEAAVAAIRGVSSLPIVALMTFDAEGETLTGVSAQRRRRAAARARPGGVRREPRRRAFGRAARARRHGRRRRRARCAAERRAREHVRAADRVPARDARVLRRVRSAGARARRRHHRRLLRDDARADRRDPRRGRREPSRRPRPLLVRERAQATPPVDDERAAPSSGGSSARARSSSPSSSTRRSARHTEALIETARAVRDSNKAQFVDVNDNPRARARMSGIMASVAIERFTGVETIPHLTPRDMTVTGLESLLLGAHAEGVRNILAVTGDPPEAGDYPGSRRRVRGRLDRPRRAARGPEPRRGLPRPRDRRADVVLPGRRGQPDRRRPRPRGRSASTARSTAGARFAMTQVLFDLEPLSSVSRSARRLADPGARRRLADPNDGAARPRAQRGARASIVPEHVQERYRRAGANAREVGGELGARADRRGARARARRLRHRAVPLADERASSSCPSFSRTRRRRSRRTPSRPSRARAARRRPARRSRRARRGARRRSSTRTAPFASIAGPPESPCWIVAGEGGDRPRDGPVPVRVLRQHDAGAADPSGRSLQRAVLRVADDLDRGAGLRIGERQRRLRSESAHAKDGDVVVRVEGDDVDRVRELRSPGSGCRVSCSPATTCAAVTTRSRVANQPLPSMPTPHAVPSTRTTSRDAR